MPLTVKLYLFDLNTFDSNKKDIPYLLDEDYLKANKYKVESSKKESLISSYFKRKYIKDYQIKEHGKPVSDNIYFNISHSNRYVIMGICDKYEIGCDIELIKDSEDRLRKYISNDTEYEFIKNDEDFYKLWTSKESLVKCLGIGLIEDIKSIPSIPIDGIKKYKGEDFYSHNIKYDNYIISVTLKSKEDFKIEVIEEDICYGN